MFNSLFSVFSVLLLGLFSLVNAVPAKPVELVAVAPTITSPTAGAIWTAGSRQNASWLTSNVPPEAQNYTVTILLGYLANNSENLDYKNPLASQIPILQGTAEVTIPSDTPYRTDYILVVIGDSGDASPPFTITSAS